ncbi:hypothetical protein OHV05_15460 [Kitasatospora sp. NBC_00070]|uniref:hypothetical protein n=1 Tax=Kitasatospora sp. NBC_00070 TaxID=2975962 RepID=UPI00324C2C54
MSWVLAVELFLLVLCAMGAGAVLGAAVTHGTDDYEARERAGGRQPYALPDSARPVSSGPLMTHRWPTYRPVMADRPLADASL